MADPLSLTASLLAIGSAAGAALKISIALYTFSRNVQAASKDIQEFALEIRVFGTLMRAGYKCLKNYYRKERNSKLIYYIKKQKLLQSLVEQSDSIEERIYSACVLVENLPSSFKWWERVKWVIRKNKVETIRPSMEKLTNSFSLLMAFVNFEALQKQGGDSEETHREKSVPSFMSLALLTRSSIYLKEQMKILIGTNSLLTQIVSKKQFSWSDSHAPMASKLSISNGDIQNKLLHLGTNIIEHDLIPDPNEYPQFVSSESVDDDSYITYVPGRSSSQWTSSRSSAAKSRRTVRSSTTATSPKVSSIAVATASRETRPKELRQEKRHIPPRQRRTSSTVVNRPSETVQSSSSRTEDIVARQSRQPPHQDPTGHDSSSDIGEENSVLVFPDQRTSGDFLSVHPTTHNLNVSLSRSSGSEILKGQLMTPKGWKHVKPLLDRNLSENLISLACVKHFGLALQPLDEGQENFQVLIDNGAPIRACGTVVLEYRRSRIWRHGLEAIDSESYEIHFKVHCLVYDHHELKTLIFGAPFQKKDQSYIENWPV
jgi:hypothetical protein